MKAFYTMMVGLSLCVGLVSCEMKDELRGAGSGTNTDMGYLDLGVAVNSSQNNVTTKADVDDDGETDVDVSVSADDFPVVITGVTDATFERIYVSYSALKAENPVELPVGEYTIAAHSNLELKNSMPEPYYEGTEEINITKGVTSSSTVKCTMKNMEVKMGYTDQFIASFQSWTVTVTDGRTTLEFVCANKTQEELNPAPVYLLVAESVSELEVRVTAVNLKGETVPEVRTLTKPSGGSSTSWTGGDALTIEMNGYIPEEDDDPTGINGSVIEINADVTFDESEDKIEVPVTPVGDDDNTDPEGPGSGEEEDPEEPVTSNLPTITIPKTTYTLPADMEADADVLIQTALKEGSGTEYVGLKSILVRIIPGNEGFSSALDLIKDVADFSEGVELVGNIGLEPMLQFIAPDLKVPTENAPSYTFPVGAFFSTLQDIGATTDPDGHVFEITVTDNNGNSPSGSVRLNVLVEE